jgi:hypothetical protein
MTAPAQLTCSYTTLVNDVGFDAFGKSPTSTDVITDQVVSAVQASQILRAIRKGLQSVYGAYRWSFLRPKLSINTYGAYSTGTITVDSSGNVTLNGGVAPADGGFPAYAASGGGLMVIQTAQPPTFYGGSWTVQTQTSATALVLASYAGPAFTAGIPYSLCFNVYPMPTGYDSFEGEVTFPPGPNIRRRPIQRVDPIEIRRRLQHDAQPRRPEMYALSMQIFDPTAGSARCFSFWPVPSHQHTLEVTGTWSAAGVDSTNIYPLGGTVLAAVITEACLAAAERDIKGMDASHPDAVHSRAVGPMLQAAIQRDREYGSADTLGVDHGHRGIAGADWNWRQLGPIWYDAGGYTGYLPPPG